MTKRIMGLIASVALLGSGVALANNDRPDKQAQNTQEQGTSKTIQMHGQILGDKEITGTVVKSSGDELKLRTDTGIISVRINKSTRFEDSTVKRVKDIKEGQQVRTSFSVERDTNIARTISLDADMGGSGLDTDTGMHQDLGGSGLDGFDPNLGSTGDVTGTGHLDDLGHQEGKTY